MSNHVKYYPSWVFSIREDITRSNMEMYDRQQEQIRSRCIAINPDYYSLPFISRMEVYKEAKKQLKII